MWFKNKKEVTSQINAAPSVPINRARPRTIDEYLALSPSERNGAILMSELITEICESLKKKP
jgi:hypothetical protein